VSANNFITKSNVKHGISHSFTFATRAIRIGEMIEERLEKKLSGEDMATMHNDTLDIMARDSMHSILTIIEQGREVLSDVDQSRIGENIKFLEEWDFRQVSDSIGATIHAGWEY